MANCNDTAACHSNWRLVLKSLKHITTPNATDLLTNTYISTAQTVQNPHATVQETRKQYGKDRASTILIYCRTLGDVTNRTTDECKVWKSSRGYCDKET